VGKKRNHINPVGVEGVREGRIKHLSNKTFRVICLLVFETVVNKLTERTCLLRKEHWTRFIIRYHHINILDAKVKIYT